MVVEAALRAGLRVQAGPHTHDHGVDGTFILASGELELMAGEKSPQGLGVDPAPIQCGVKTAPAATMRCFKTQVDGGRDAIRGLPQPRRCDASRLRWTGEGTPSAVSMASVSSKRASDRGRSEERRVGKE